MYRLLIILLLPLLCSIPQTHANTPKTNTWELRNNIGPQDIDWKGYFTTPSGKKIYCPKAYREKRKQYAIKKQQERTKNWSLGIGSMIALILGYRIYKNKRKPASPTTSDIKNPPHKDLEKEQARNKQLQLLNPDTPNPTHPHLEKPCKNSIRTNDTTYSLPSLTAESKHDPKEQQGREYEYYIGHMLEQQNHLVFYRGAVLETADKGIDLIAIKNNQIRLIQCKCFNNDIEINQIKKLIRHIEYDWKIDPKSPIHGQSHNWELHYTPWLSKGAYQACLNKNILLTTQSAGIAPPIKAFTLNGEKCYITETQQHYHRISILPGTLGQNYFHNSKHAENAGYKHLQLIDINTANAITRQTIHDYARANPQNSLETLMRPWLDF